MKTRGKTELVSVEKLSDDLWIVVTRQTNTEIAGSPRNSFWASLSFEACGGRALIGSRAALCSTSLSQTANATCGLLGVRLWGISSISQEGNNPEYRIRSLNLY